MNRYMRYGLTLIELLITLTLLAFLAGVVIFTINPVGQIRQARNTERLSHLNTFSNAIGQNLADNRGTLFCGSVSSTIPTTSTMMGSAAGRYNIAPCLIPIYLPFLPLDPSEASAYWTSLSDYNTAYTVMRNTSTGAITLTAPFAEAGKTVSVTR